MNTLDCKEEIFNSLIENDYEKLSFNEKKELVSTLFKNYLANRIDWFYGFDNVCKKYKLSELINYLSDSECIIPLIKCLISIIERTQNSPIYWIIYPNIDGIKINYTKNCIISIYTDNNYSFVFNYLFDYYLNMFEIKDKKHIKQL